MSRASSPLRSALKHGADGKAERQSAAGYSRGVGFDIFSSNQAPAATGGGTGLPISFTLTSHSRGFTRSRSTRTFLVATDMAKYSVNAIHWTLESLLEDGDEVVILRVIEPGSGVAGKAWEGREGPEEAREDAEEVLDGVMLFNAEKRKVSIVVEFVVGQIEESIHRMIEVYQPDALIVGTKGLKDSIFKSNIGSISKYCIAKAPVPVIVVRPEDRPKTSESSEAGHLLGRPQTAPDTGESRGREGRKSDEREQSRERTRSR